MGVFPAANYIENFKDKESIHAFSPGFGFKDECGLAPESDDEGMDSSAPRTIQLPLAKDGIRVAATADLHGNHLRGYIEADNGQIRISLKDAGALPADTELLIFAGDLGCEFNEELPVDSGAYEDRQSSREDPAETDKRHLGRWRELLGTLLERHPGMHICLLAGNHDGLLCSQRDCMSCTTTDCSAGRARWPLPGGSIGGLDAGALGGGNDRPGQGPAVGTTGDTPDEGRGGGEAPDEQLEEAESPPAPTNGISRSVLAEVEAGLSGELKRRLYWLDDSWVTLDFGPGRRLTVYGSAWTPRFRPGGAQHMTHEAWDHAWWVRHWAQLERCALESASQGTPWVLATHGPPQGRLDYVGKGKLPVGDPYLMMQLQRMARGDPPIHLGGNEQTSVSRRPGVPPVNRAPVLHVFGHVHAQQFEDEVKDSPRFVADAPHGILFLNCAAEKQIPNMSSSGLQGQATRKARRARATLGGDDSCQEAKARALGSSSTDDEGTDDERRPVKFSHTKYGRRPGFGNRSAGFMSTAESSSVAKKDARVWLRPPALVLLPLSGRLVDWKPRN